MHLLWKRESTGMNIKIDWSNTRNVINVLWVSETRFQYSVVYWLFKTTLGCLCFGDYGPEIVAQIKDIVNKRKTNK